MGFFENLFTKFPTPRTAEEIEKQRRERRYRLFQEQAAESEKDACKEFGTLRKSGKKPTELPTLTPLNNV